MLNYDTIIDISLPLEEGMINYPGNPALTLEDATSPGGSALNKITMGSHTGTHIDAPKHAGFEGGVDSYRLHQLIGKCRVVDVTHEPEAITLASVEGLHVHEGERLLFRTQNSLRGYDQFREDYIYMASDAAQFLAEQGVGLVGVDYLSIKQKGLDDNAAHEAFLKRGIPIVEGLNLQYAEAGEYKLVVLPLAFQGLDGAPARAVLIA